MIKILRLVTGEDVVSETEKKDGFYILKKPHRLLFSHEGLASMPLCPFCKNKDFEISFDKVLFEGEPEDEIRDSYASQVGAIVVPTSTLVTP